MDLAGPPLYNPRAGAFDACRIAERAARGRRGIPKGEPR